MTKIFREQKSSGMRLRFIHKRKALVTFLLLLMAAGALLAQTSPHGRVVYLSYEDAKPILEAEAEILPQELSGKSPSELALAWPKWVARHDAEIRARLAQGDEDTVVNFLLFGMSYTRQPRITQKQIQQIGQQQNGAAS